ncbi:MAG TPA: ABC transporter permease [Gemmatimonadaceae bacterium]|nr:ABC transporter permease [Gemmatimonadaceae bacterium]
MDALLSDLRYAARSLLRAPGFTIAAVLCLAIGIGANATMFGVVDTLLLRPPRHVTEPERVARLYIRRDVPGFGTIFASNVSYPDLEDWSRVPVFEKVGGFFTSDASIGRGPDAVEERVGLATPSFFPLLGVRPALGRFFVAEDNAAPSGNPVAVLSWEYWQQRYGGDREVLGRTIEVDGVTYTIVGVAPEAFAGVDLRAPKLWVPARAMGRAVPLAESDLLASRNWQWIEVVARLRPGASWEAAQEQATLATKRAYAGTPDSARAGTVVLGGILRDRGPERSASAKVAVWLTGVAAVVLLIACANVANLLIVRAARRRREIAVRLAMGMGRGRLVRLLITESVVLAALGGGAALLVASWGGSLIRAFLLPDVAALDDAVSGRVLLFTALATFATGVLCGLLPALQASRPELTTALKSGAREGTYRRSRARAGLLVAQVALTLVLLVGAGLFARSLRNATTHDLGYDADRMLVATMDLTSMGYDSVRAEALWRRMHDEVAALPGVEQASLGASLPFWMSFSFGLYIPGRDSIPRLRGGGPYANAVTPEFFQTTGIPIRQGRAFGAGDVKGAPPVAVVSEAMARALWPGRNAIGQCFRMSADTLPCFEIVGIAADAVRDRIDEPAAAQYWVPLDQARAFVPRNRALYVRTSGDAEKSVAPVRRAIQSLAGDLPYANVRPFADLVAPQIRPWRLGASMFGLFGLVALALAVIGLYGVLAYTVSQRTQELGVRIALGARERDIVSLVVGEGVRVTIIGIALGAAGAWAGSKALAALLFGVSAHDPAVYATVALTLLATALAASWLPAWRASRVDPMAALRVE